MEDFLINPQRIQLTLVITRTFQSASLVSAAWEGLEGWPAVLWSLVLESCLHSTKSLLSVAFGAGHDGCWKVKSLPPPNLLLSYLILAP